MAAHVVSSASVVSNRVCQAFQLSGALPGLLMRGGSARGDSAASGLML